MARNCRLENVFKDLAGESVLFAVVHETRVSNAVLKIQAIAGRPGSVFKRATLELLSLQAEVCYGTPNDIGRFIGRNSYACVYANLLISIEQVVSGESSLVAENCPYAATEFAQRATRLLQAPPAIRLEGLDSKAIYRVQVLGQSGAQEQSGAYLMQSGVSVRLGGDYDSTALLIERQ